jgi:cytochrome d ubiquinol oxidase subunit I
LKTSDSIAPVAAPAVGASLLAFIVVYFIVFGAGTLYLLALMRRPVERAEPDRVDEAPTRTAGITPAPAVPQGAGD